MYLIETNVIGADRGEFHVRHSHEQAVQCAQDERTRPNVESVHVYQIKSWEHLRSFAPVEVG